MTKLRQLEQIEGMSAEEMVQEELFGDSAGIPGICMNKGCDYTTICEPDARRNYCEECQTNSVASAAVLMGII